MNNALSRPLALEGLKGILYTIPETGKTADVPYGYRYEQVLYAMAYAARAGLRTGYRLDPKCPDWPVAFIELPTGQVSWHMPPFAEEWDGHTTEQKMERIEEFLKPKEEATVSDFKHALQRQATKPWVKKAERGEMAEGIEKAEKAGRGDIVAGAKKLGLDTARPSLKPALAKAKKPKASRK